MAGLIWELVAVQVMGPIPSGKQCSCKMEIVRLPAGVRFTKIDKERGKHGWLYVLEVTIPFVPPWIGQSASTLCAGMEHPFHCRTIYAVLRNKQDKATQRVRPRQLRLDQIDELNKLVAGGCTVVCHEPEKWHIMEMRLLNLFSGTDSVGEAFRAAGWDTVSVDIKPQRPVRHRGGHPARWTRAELDRHPRPLRRHLGLAALHGVQHRPHGGQAAAGPGGRRQAGPPRREYIDGAPAHAGGSSRTPTPAC
jgi:hypothetical protein